MTDTPKPAPATPAATPMAAKLTDEQRRLIGGWWNRIASAAYHADLQNQEQWKAIEAIAYALFKYLPSVEAALRPAAAQPQRESEVQSIFTVEQVRDALIASSPQGFDLSKCGVNEHILVDELNERLPLAAQRESEQPEQALREALLKVRSYNVDILAGRINYRPQDHIDVIDAALSPQTDSQEQP